MATTASTFGAASAAMFAGSQTSASAAGVGRVPIKSFGSSKNTQSIKQTETQKSFNAALASRNVDGAGNALDNPIINNIKNRVPNEQVTPPKNRGNAPISNKDRRPIEIHHNDQNSDGPFYEMHPSDHRYGENYQKNHPNYNEPSKIDRNQFRKDKREYWENEWDNGR